MNAMRTHLPVNATLAVLVDQTEFMRRRVVRTLAQRQRYRYVEPQVEATPAGFLIRSPCCSRNVDPAGGVIQIASITRLDEVWQLFSHDHKKREWVFYDAFDSLDALLQVICVDSDRLFWP
ncbi:MAG TPA: DUF3024 domain-containing protein [Rhodocyclaceae bacterium]|nr:DUF3024 domain-containing protein [Rhodocyclaceae bacterium]